MTERARLTDEALRQIIDISDYIARDSRKNARRWRDGLRRKIAMLCNTAKSHAVLYTKEQAGREVRQTFYGVYRILYTVERDHIVVLTIRHGAKRPFGPSEIEGID